MYKVGINNKREDAGCEKCGSELLRKWWSNRQKRRFGLRNSQGVRKAVTIWVSMFGGTDGGKESFGEQIDGMENCCSQEIQSSLG